MAFSKKTDGRSVALALASLTAVGVGSVLAASANSYGLVVMLIGDVALYVMLAFRIKTTLGGSELPPA